MADNVNITAGANATPPDGTVVATDDVGGVQYQRVKLDVGGDGSSTPVTSTGLPINDAGGSLTVDGTVAVSGTVTVNGSGSTQPISAVALPLPTGAATDTLQTAGNALLGAVTEGAPANDTASAGLNGRLQRIAQRLTSLIALLPASLGQKASAASLAVTIASDQSAVPVTLTSTTITGTVAVTDNGGSITVDAAGDVAHDAIDSGNPVKVGGYASSSAPTVVQTGDRVQGWYDLYGRAVVSDLDPEYGSGTAQTNLRDRQVAQRYTVLSDSVADGLAAFWSQNTGNGGSIGLSIGEGILSTSASATGFAQMVSPLVIYFPGQVTWFNSAFRMSDTGSAGNIRRWGTFTVSGTTPQDGFYYELNGTTLNAVTVKAGTATAIASTSWSRVTPAPFTLDLSYHQWEIRWTANTCWFLVDNVVRHVATGGTSSLTQTLNFPIAMQTVNSSGASDRYIAIRNCGIGRFGTPELVKGTSDAIDNAVALPPTSGVMAGWDGTGVRTAFMQNLDGHNSLFTHDNLNRRLLEEVLVELRLLNAQTARMLGPQALTQRDLEPLRLIT